MTVPACVRKHANMSHKLGRTKLICKADIKKRYAGNYTNQYQGALLNKGTSNMCLCVCECVCTLARACVRACKS